MRKLAFIAAVLAAISLSAILCLCCWRWFFVFPLRLFGPIDDIVTFGDALQGWALLGMIKGGFGIICLFMPLCILFMFFVGWPLAIFQILFGKE
jgi:hypothetical protein